MAEPAVTALAYAAPPSRWRRRRLRLFVAALLLLFTAGGLWLWRGPRALEQAKLLYWQRQCLNYSPPEGQVVWEPDPAAAAALLRADAPQYADVRTQGMTQVGAARKSPEAWVRLAARFTNYDPFGLVDPMLPLVYLHERRTSSGLRRLVAVYHCPEWAHVGPTPLLLYAVVIEPAPLSGAPRALSISANWTEIHHDARFGQARPPIRYFAGQTDPDSASRFTIPYETAGRRGIIGLRLQDDGRSIASTDPELPGQPPTGPMREWERIDY